MSVTNSNTILCCCLDINIVVTYSHVVESLSSCFAQCRKQCLTPVLSQLKNMHKTISTYLEEKTHITILISQNVALFVYINHYHVYLLAYDSMIILYVSNNQVAQLEHTCSNAINPEQKTENIAQNQYKI